MNILNRINSIILNEEKFLSKIRYNKEGYYVHQKTKQIEFKVSVIVPVFNAEDTIKQTIDSILNQSIGFKHLEVLIIDDYSTDNSRKIILEYSKEHENISPIFLEQNTGSPAIPRNLGIDLAKGEFITFIDADDWLHPEGLQSLYGLLNSSGNDYAIGKTIKVTDNGKYIIGEYNSWTTRQSVNPFSIDRLFYHLGPTARMVRTSLLRDNGIKYPNKRFAEDKQFFIDVLIHCSRISTSENVIYYANRKRNNKSLTTKTDIFEKTDANIKVIDYVINKKLPIQKEKMILNRLYEFDCITRLFNRKHFLVSTDKEKYFDKFQEVLETTNKLQYNFQDNFKHDWHRLLIDFFNKKNFNKLVSLIEWSYNQTTKQIIIKNELPHYVIMIGSERYLARVPMHAQFISSVRKNDNITIKYELYGDCVNHINSLVIRQRNNELNELEFPIAHKFDNEYETVIPLEHIATLEKASYSMFIKYNNYEKVSLKMNTRSILEYNKQLLDFYTTIADNYGLNIK